MADRADQIAALIPTDAGSRRYMARLIRTTVATAMRGVIDILRREMHTPDVNRIVKLIEARIVEVERDGTTPE